ncbi:MAG: DASS family sodium-coupled anion symporter [Pseudomonadota bacterium]
MSSATILPRSRAQIVGLITGLLIFCVMVLSPVPEALSREAWTVAALAAAMVVLWVTEALPIPATALMPLVVLPMAGVSSLREASAYYMSPIVVLLMAGFMIAKAIEKWQLHERIALFVVAKVGTSPPALIAGFMISSALLSMWISNTATALMMTPIALSVSRAVVGPSSDTSSFTIALVLAVAYACSIGGLATPVGSPTNLIVIGYLSEQGIDIAFADWMSFGLPVVLCILPMAWFILSGRAKRGTQIAPQDPSGSRDVFKIIAEARSALGPITTPEKRVLMVFALIAFSWMFSRPLRGLPLLENLNDQIIAVAGAIMLFAMPSGAKEARSAPLLDWRTAEGIPWGVVLLFGGGLSLAGAMSQTGLATAIAGLFAGLSGAPDLVLILVVTLLILSMTEVTSNVATVSALLPMVGALAIATDTDLLTLVAPLGLAASCAFMLPMATGPNAVAFASGQVTLSEMARTGVAINIVSAIIITLLTFIII